MKRIYTLLIVILGWVFFRAENLDHALLFIKKMFSFTTGANNEIYFHINSYFIFIAVLGIVFATPARAFIQNKLSLITKNNKWLAVSMNGFYLLLFLYSLMELAQTTYNPFIYFRF